MTVYIPPPPGVIENNIKEITYQRRNTKAFIDADPIQVTLTETPRTETADGGWRKGAPVARDLQTFRLIPQSDIMPQVQTPDGIALTPGYVLLGEHSCIMERWDTFELNGLKFMIVSPVRPDVRLYVNAYERKADVARY